MRTNAVYQRTDKRLVFAEFYEQSKGFLAKLYEHGNPKKPVFIHEKTLDALERKAYDYARRF